jgi:hypothetical protein
VFAHLAIAEDISVQRIQAVGETQNALAEMLRPNITTGEIGWMPVKSLETMASVWVSATLDAMIPNSKQADGERHGRRGGTGRRHAQNNCPHQLTT